MESLPPCLEVVFDLRLSFDFRWLADAAENLLIGSIPSKGNRALGVSGEAKGSLIHLVMASAGFANVSNRQGLMSCPPRMVPEPMLGFHANRVFLSIKNTRFAACAQARFRESQAPIGAWPAR